MARGCDIEQRFAAVVGAPRCGTTSLARYLGAHPEVCFSAVKEPHFFSQFDLRRLPTQELCDTIQKEYLARYFPAASGTQMLMEGSVTYLYVPEQIEPILRMWPDAKFIISVRDPFVMLPSLHRRLMYIGDETEADFGRAWALAAERAEGKHIPRTCFDPRWLLYPEIGKLGKYVEQFIETVGRERCHIVLFDDFAADPSGEYRRVLSFLGLSDDHRTDFAPQRESRGFRWGWLQRLLKRPPKRVRAVMAGEKFQLRFREINAKSEPEWAKFVLRARTALLRWNATPAPKVMLSPDMQIRMRQGLSADVVRLAHLLGRDLSHWLGGVPEAKPTTEVRRASRSA